MSDQPAMLREAAALIRREQDEAEMRGHILAREYDAWLEVASWLDHQATHAERAVKFGDYDERHWQSPLAIARAYLGQPTHPAPTSTGAGTDEEEAVRGKELMCEQCGCTRWACLTKFDGECCTGCDHPEETA